jgi:hypothetical protein
LLLLLLDSCAAGRLWLIIGVGVVAEGIVLGGGRRAAAHRYGAHIGIEGGVGDERGAWWWKGLRHVLLIVL